MVEEPLFFPPPPVYDPRPPKRSAFEFPFSACNREEYTTSSIPRRAITVQHDKLKSQHDGSSHIIRQGSFRLLPGSKFWVLIDKWWLWELLSWIFAAFCILAIVVLLVFYNGRVLPQWPLGLTINAYVSVLGAFAKAGLLLPTAVRGSLTTILKLTDI